MSDASTVCVPRTGYGRHVLHKWLIGKDEDKHARDGDRHVRKGSQPSLSLSRVREKLESVVSIAAAARSGAPDDPFSFCWQIKCMYI